MSAELVAAIKVKAPGAGSAVTAGAASTAATALPSGCTKLWIKGSTKVHVIFGGSGVAAAQASDMPLTADVDYILDIGAGITHFRAIRASADSTVNYVDVSP